MFDNYCVTALNKIINKIKNKKSNKTLNIKIEVSYESVIYFYRLSPKYIQMDLSTDNEVSIYV